MLAEKWLISPQDYLAGEQTSEVKYEYVNGHLYAMAGASREHNRITANVLTALNMHLRGGPCQVFMADMKVHIKTDTDEWFYYPDVMVSCNPSGEQYYEANPSLIVEVLSETTERNDREGKFQAYRCLESMKEYVLVHQDQRLVEVYRRSKNWQPEFYSLEQTFCLRSVELDTSMGDWYVGMVGI